jgi:hypothetical protein
MNDLLSCIADDHNYLHQTYCIIDEADLMMGPTCFTNIPSDIDNKEFQL